MEEVISKQTADELMKLKGEIRAVALKNYAQYILKEEGEEGLKKLEDEMARLSYPIKYREIKSMNFYPLGFQALTIAAIKHLFNYDNKKFQELGGFEPKVSLIIRLFIKYFVSLDKIAKEVPKIWQKYYTKGSLEVTELNKEKRYIILRLKDHRCHPTQCQALTGYFGSVLQMIVKDNITCEETKCIFRGDAYHEFLLKW